MAREPECLHHLPFLRISIGKNHINNTRGVTLSGVEGWHRLHFLFVLEPKRNTQSIAHPFTQRTCTERYIANASFEVPRQS